MEGKEGDLRGLVIKRRKKRLLVGSELKELENRIKVELLGFLLF